MSWPLRVSAILVLGLAGCDRIPGTPEADAKAALSAVLFDPAAAKITYDLKTSTAVCGSVNGKNRMGAYVGAQPYVYVKAVRTPFVYSGPVEMSDIRLLNYADHDAMVEAYQEIDAKCGFADIWQANCGTTPPVASSTICLRWKSGPKGQQGLMQEAERGY